MSSRKIKITRSTFAPDSKGRFADRYTDHEGVLFNYSLNIQKKRYYMAIGTLSLLDPNTLETMKLYDMETEKFTLASQQIHIRFPNADENLETLIDTELYRAATILKQRYQSQFNTARKYGKTLSEMTFFEAECAFLESAKMSFSQSANMQNQYASSIRTFSNKFHDKKIGSIKKKALLGAVDSMHDGGLKKLQHLKAYVDYICAEQKSTSTFLEVIDSAINSINKKDKTAAKNSQAAKNASNSDILSDEAEWEFNKRIYEHKYEASYVALAMIKGTGLTPTELCNLKMEQVQLNPQNNYAVFLAIKKWYVSATQNYTFPIFPFEAKLLNDYIDDLIKNFGDSRLSNENYLFSSDNGESPLQESDIKQLCKTELQLLKIGYADLLKRVDLQKEKGVELLKMTYRSRLERCGLSKSSDEGAYLFMLHQSLGNKVQADHYRGLTGESGREFLLSIVMQDKRFIEEDDIKRYRKEKTHRTIGNRREYTLRRKDTRNIHQATITIELEANETAEFSADHGCTVCIEQVTPLTSNI